jgi:hypothetical protein
VLPSNIRIGPQISVFAPEFNFWYLRSGLKKNMSKVQGKMVKLYFNQINTFQNIGIKFKITWNGIISSNVYIVLNKNFHSNVNVLGRFYKHFLTSLYKTWSKNICKLNKGNSLKDLFSQFVSSKIFSAI